MDQRKTDPGQRKEAATLSGIEVVEVVVMVVVVVVEVVAVEVMMLL